MTKKNEMLRRIRNRIFRRERTWADDKKETLMLIATVIATVTFESLINPPKELTEDFLNYNTISFISALFVILLIISGAPVNNKACTWLLTASMISVIIFLALAFRSVLKAVAEDHSPDNSDHTTLSPNVGYSWHGSIDNAYYGTIIAFMGVFGLVFFVRTAYLIHSLIGPDRCRLEQAQREGEEMV